jgi:hypothetical protein
VSSPAKAGDPVTSGAAEYGIPRFRDAFAGDDTAVSRSAIQTLRAMHNPAVTGASHFVADDTNVMRL